MPATLIGLVWLAFFIFRRWKFRKYLAILGFSLFVIFTNDFLANSFLKAYQSPPADLQQIKSRHYTYGVLLTGMTNTLKEPKDRVYFNQNADRLLQSIMLFEQGIIDTLYISGGGATALRKDLQESAVLLGYLKSINFPVARVKIEDQSRNTVESARLASDFIDKSRPLLLITSASHMPRAAGCFRKQGFQLTEYPTVYYTNDQLISPSMFLPSDDALFKWHTLFKEWMGYTAYWLAGYL
ncbi:YdcF family protein [Marivirga arenosa]|uniref:YdcF family protein n=1 Tax=Marivirga arenosa TaxID=3059076 RepID=A0AA49GCA6_9BACT|nr:MULTISPECIES: YdcF family protein [unclassified Marivirga]WKK79351.2 YdcF family protein [Marivirga sp. BKB1-2]WMN06121.1 YdcF family protein [Marivirga sp. ABR2-2]